MRRLALLAVASFLALSGCSDDGTLFPSSIVCRSNADCPTGSTCQSGVCIGSDGSPTRPTETDTGNTTLDAGTGNDTGSTLDVSIEDTSCTPSCAGRECGDDGCGGTCGTCPAGDSCAAGICQAGGGGTLDCVGILNCVNTNQCQDQACLEGCLGQGDATSQQQFINVLTCIQDNCADAATDQEFAECQNTQCSAEISTCTGGGGGGGTTGADTCNEVITCIMGCSDQTCANACVGNGTAGAQNAAIGFYNCAVENCADATSAADFLSCGRSSCPTQAAECDAN